MAPPDLPTTPGDDGERMDPSRSHARTFREHVARYRFAAAYARGRRVLDVASGEGYGSAGLREAGAASVAGLDVSPGACERAARRYGIEAAAADAHRLPMADGAFDLVVSFETIEHLAAPGRFLDECARALDPAGMLIVSTPNRPVYSAEVANPHHLAELDRGEFAALLDARFGSVAWFTQFPRWAPWWDPRSLASERSPWHRIKGFWRASTWLCPALRPVLSPAERSDVARSIARPPRGGPSTLFDPYRVRPERPSSRERPYYYVAVARRPRPR